MNIHKKKILNKRGFTLIELLAVIVVLAIIMVVTIPSVIRATNSAKESQLQNAADNVKDWFVKQDEIAKFDDIAGNSDPSYIELLKERKISYTNAPLQLTDAVLEAAGISNPEKNIEAYNSYVYTSNNHICVRLKASSNGSFSNSNNNAKTSSNCESNPSDVTIPEGKIAYIMAPKKSASATSLFWDSPINANQVRSISFVNSSQIIANASDPFSLNGDGDVTMRYVKNGKADDGIIDLYDVYVGSPSGIVQASNNNDYVMGLFQYLTNCLSINLQGLDTSELTSMNYMFRGSSKLTSLNLDSFDTSKVKTMISMFEGCNSLSDTLNVSSFSTSKVENMAAMFYGCSKLTSIDGLTSFTTSSTTSIGYMFFGCENLTSLDLSSFNTKKVTTMTKTFFNCENLTTIYVSDLWTINAVTSGEDMFYNCSALVGQNGTKYNSSNISSYTYAVIDTEDTPGYLTKK